MSKAERGMAAEFREAPAVVRRQQQILAAPLAGLVRLLRRRPPQVVVTCARGSSAHAATFGKHLIERHLGIAVAAAAPSIATVYRQRLRLENQLFLAISQSGRSDDLVEMAAMAKAAGAVTAAIVNNAESPLAATCEFVLPMAAGAEVSVAATKTFVASLAALLGMTAAWADDAALVGAVARLADRLDAVEKLDWSAAVAALSAAKSLVIIGRGPTLAIAREASLKFKETCDLHAEAFSGAEFLHGPIALVSTLYPVLLFMPTDVAATGLKALAADLRRKGARVFVAGGEGADALPVLAPDHPDTDAVCLIQSFYALLMQIAKRRGTNVNRPRHLQKVTRTR